MTFEIREATSSTDWEGVRAIRQAVFVEEQACPPEEEWDEHDAPDLRERRVHHLLGTVEGLPVACTRWREVWKEGTGRIKIERVAVLAPFRRQGYARRLVGRALDQAQADGHTRFVLHAQTQAVGLYGAFGFEPEGEPFEEAGIEHVKMTLTVS